jgi:hypothetical protein
MEGLLSNCPIAQRSPGISYFLICGLCHYLISKLQACSFKLSPRKFYNYEFYMNVFLQSYAEIVFFLQKLFHLQGTLPLNQATP